MDTEQISGRALTKLQISVQVLEPFLLSKATSSQQSFSSCDLLKLPAF